MIIGFDSFFTGECFDSCIESGEIYNITLSNAKIDEIKVDTSSDIVYDSNLQDWGIDGALLCAFENLTFEAGNISLAGMPIEYLRIRKRKTDELEWQTYTNIPFDSNETEYSWSDYFVETYETYDYCVLPVGAMNVEGEYTIKSGSVSYEDIWILGLDNEQYHLKANINSGQIETVSPNAEIQCLGSRYPFFISNGMISYRKSSVKAMLISDDTINAGKTNNISDKRLRESFYNFLTNKKPKVFKDGNNGIMMLIAVKPDSVKLEPNNDLGRTVFDVSFDYIETGDVYDTETLIQNGILDLYPSD